MSLQELRHPEPSPVEWSTDWANYDVISPAFRSGRTPVRTVPDEGWQGHVERRLTALTRLEIGWDGYRAPAPSVALTAFAMSVLHSVMKPGVPPPSIVPTHGGGIQLEWHVGGMDIELMIFRPFDAELSVEFLNGGEPIEDQPLSADFATLGEVLGKLV